MLSMSEPLEVCGSRRRQSASSLAVASLVAIKLAAGGSWTFGSVRSCRGLGITEAKTDAEQEERERGRIKK